MEKIIGKEFGGERPLYRGHGLYLENVVIHAGESALKETGDITCVNCRFEGKYPLWECDGFVVRDSILTVGARSGLWYSRNGELYDTIIDALKADRQAVQSGKMPVQTTNSGLAAKGATKTPAADASKETKASDESTKAGDAGKARPGQRDPEPGVRAVGGLHVAGPGVDAGEPGL